MSGKTVVWHTGNIGGKPITKSGGYRVESWESQVKGMQTRAKKRKQRKKRKSR